jgi:hypothetical protein
MEKSRKFLLISGAAALLVCGAVFLADRRLSLGLLAGYFTGLVDFFLISFQVKRIIGAAGATPSKIVLGSFFYLLRLLGAAAIIAAVVINSKYFSIAGFLAGFTVCVAAIIAAHKLNPQTT